MRTLPAIAAFAFALTGAAGTAQACRFTRPAPPVVQFPYQALALGTVIRLHGDGPAAEIRIERIIDGRSATRRLRLDRPIFTLPCAPRYEMHARDRVFLVVRPGPQGPILYSWLPLDVARLREPLVADYLSAADGRERRRVVARWRRQHWAQLPSP